MVGGSLTGSDCYSAHSIIGGTYTSSRDDSAVQCHLRLKHGVQVSTRMCFDCIECGSIGASRGCLLREALKLM